MSDFGKKEERLLFARHSGSGTIFICAMDRSKKPVTGSSYLG